MTSFSALMSFVEDEPIETSVSSVLMCRSYARRLFCEDCRVSEQ